MKAPLGSRSLKPKGRTKINQSIDAEMDVGSGGQLN
jgi:hypothetical protein